GLGPRDGCRIRLREGADGLLADAQRVLGVQYRLAEASHDGVVLQQVGQGGVIGQVVDRDDVEVRVHLTHRAEEAAPHAAATVDADVDFLLVASWHVYCHFPFASSVLRGRVPADIISRRRSIYWFVVLGVGGFQFPILGIIRRPGRGPRSPPRGCPECPAPRLAYPPSKAGGGCGRPPRPSSSAVTPAGRVPPGRPAGA